MVLDIYPESCKVLKLKHYIHSPFEKSLMERVNQQYFKILHSMYFATYKTYVEFATTKDIIVVPTIIHNKQ